jgi:aerobic carbon-monoxide dehydrogenase medium subunit
LITVAALEIDQKIRIAISGLCPFPFRVNKVEEFLNNRQLSYKERITMALNDLPSPILNDVEGSADYRIFVLQNLLLDVLTRLEG